MTLAEILALIVPRGWFLPVVPGTRWVSVGGAIANDIHGKNHHRAGTFGAHVTRLELAPLDRRARRLRAGGRAVPGHGRRPGPHRTDHLGGDPAQARSRTPASRWSGSGSPASTGSSSSRRRTRPSSTRWPGWTAWRAGARLGRGIYMRGDHAPLDGPAPSPLGAARLTVPVDAPAGLLNRVTLALFNEAYYRGQLGTPPPERRPLRAVLLSARRRGRLDPALRAARLRPVPVRRARARRPRADPDDLRAHRRSGEPASLAVLKRFGAARSPGMLSFPREGITLAVDFAVRGDRHVRPAGRSRRDRSRGGRRRLSGQGRAHEPGELPGVLPRARSVPPPPGSQVLLLVLAAGACLLSAPIRVLIVGATSAIATETARDLRRVRSPALPGRRGTPSGSRRWPPTSGCAVPRRSRPPCST